MARAPRPPARRWLRRPASLAAPIAGLLALALYACTLAPGLTWAHNGADGGDFLAAALTHGVPHPSGYPTYLLLLRGIIAVFPGEPARAGNWLSALCAAAAVALFADLVRRMLDASCSTIPMEEAEAAPTPPERRVLREEPDPLLPGQPHPTRNGLIAVVAALTWGASPTFWSQAVITEVYALNALVVVALCWLLWRWRAALDEGHQGWPWLAVAGLILGLGLGNHLSLVLMLPGAAVWLWSGRREGGKDLFRGVLAAAAATAAGLAVYAYLPLMAATQPPINWEDPRTPAQLWQLVSGNIYRNLVFGVPLAYLPGRLAAWVGEALRQFGGPWGALLALAGLWRLDRRAHAWWQTTALIALAYTVYAIGYNTPDSFVYLIPVWCMAALWLAMGLDWLWEEVEGFLRRERRASRAWNLAVIFLLCAIPAISVARFWRANDLSREQEARTFLTQALSDAAPGAVILTATDDPTFALWYAIYGLGQRADVTPMNVNLYMFGWYRRSLANRHPDLVEAMGGVDRPQLGHFLTEVAASRPLYRAEPLSIAQSEFTEEPAGSLVRLRRSGDK
jgi:hypothetical protein